MRGTFRIFSRAGIGLSTCAMSVLLAGCGGSGSTSTPTTQAISVTVSPATTSLSGGGSHTFSATVANDSANAGVTWSIGTGAGTLSASSTSSVTFTAPAAVTTTTSVTLTATSKTDTSMSAAATITLNPASTPPTITSVAVSCNPTSVQTAATSQCTPTVAGTGSYSPAVTWSVGGVQGGNSTLGTISPAGLYSAPSTVPSTNPVTVTATSTQDTTQSASTTLTITVVSSELQIDSFSETSVDPLAQLTITGTGFDPTNAAISVLLIPESGGTPIAVPAFAATSTTVQIAVPLFLNEGTGTFTVGNMNLQVIQLDGSTLSTSNVLTGLTINAPPAVPTGVAAGAITLAFLAESSNVSSAIQTDASTNPSLATLGTDLAQYNTDLSSLGSAIAPIANGTSQSATVPTADGLTFSLNPQVVALSDQLILTYLQQFVAQMGTSLPTASTSARRGKELGSAQRRSVSPSGQASTSCSFNTGDPATDAEFCSFQDYGQNQYTVGVQAVQLGAKIETGLYLGILGGWAVEGLEGASLVGENAAQALQIAWSAASSNIAAFVTASKPPPLYDSLKGAVAQIVDNSTLGGIGILPAAVDSVAIYNDASELAPSSAGEAPEGGVIVTGPQQNAPTGTTIVFGSQIADGSTTTTEFAAPNTQQTESISAATVNQTGFDLNFSATGSGGGTISATPLGAICGSNCYEYASGTPVILTPNPSSGSAFAGWSGACSGTGTCSVTMKSNLAVSATFTNGTTDAVTPLNVGSVGGCAGGTLTGNVTVTAPSGVTWIAYANQNDGDDFGITPATVSGSGSGVVSYTLTAYTQYGTCTDTTPISERMGLAVFNFSDGTQLNDAVNFTYIWVN
jgi:hypothetical protein